MTSRIQPLLKPDSRAKRQRVDYRNFAIPKNPAEPDARFRQFARDRGCEIRRRSPKTHRRCTPVIGTDYTPRPLIDFIHVPTGRTKAMGRKGSDLGGGFGGCHDLHMEQERIGWKRFSEKYGIDPLSIAHEVRDEYEKRTAKERRS